MIPKDERGFSFVELMTIIVILCIITIASYPIIISVVKDTKTGLYKENIKELERASMAWATKNAKNLPDDEKDARFLTIEKLYKDGFIKNEEVVDPRREGEYISGCIIVKKNKDGQYKAKFHELSCNEAGKDYRPKIKVVKDAKKTYEVNSEVAYEMPKIEATSITGKTLEVEYPIIKKDGALTTYVEGTKVGETYQLIYTVKDPVNGLSSKKEFTVKIVDTKAPVITVDGETKGYTEEIVLGNNYDIPEAIVQDNSLENLKVNISTDLNTKMPGNYEVVYTATDSHENLGIFVLKVNVVKDEMPKENQIIIDNASVLPGDGVLKKQQNSTYTFAGTNPNNYIKFNQELWRILTVDNKGIKIVRHAPIKAMQWSNKKSTHIDDSLIYNYLNQTYLKTISEIENLNDKVRFNISAVDLKNMTTFEQLKREESKIQTAKMLSVGLLTMSDYIMASNNQTCLANGENCTASNYLVKAKSYWLSHMTSDRNNMYLSTSSGITIAPPTEIHDVYPVLYLSGYHTFLGTGTETDPYIIQN